MHKALRVRYNNDDEDDSAQTTSFECALDIVATPLLSALYARHGVELLSSPQADSVGAAHAMALMQDCVNVYNRMKINLPLSASHAKSIVKLNIFYFLKILIENCFFFPSFQNKLLMILY